MSSLVAGQGLGSWILVMVAFVAISAIPPGIALYRRTYEVGYIAGLVGVPMAVTIWFGLTFPVWVVLWLVAFVKAIRAPGRERRSTGKRREAEVLQRIAEESRRSTALPGPPGSVGPSGAMGQGPGPGAAPAGRSPEAVPPGPPPSFGVPRAAWRRAPLPDPPEPT